VSGSIVCDWLSKKSEYLLSWPFRMFTRDEKNFVNFGKSCFSSENQPLLLRNTWVSNIIRVSIGVFFDGSVHNSCRQSSSTTPLQGIPLYSSLYMLQPWIFHFQTKAVLKLCTTGMWNEAMWQQLQESKQRKMYIRWFLMKITVLWEISVIRAFRLLSTNFLATWFSSIS